MAKTKYDRLRKMVDIIIDMAKDEEVVDLNIKEFITDMAHDFNLRKRDIDLENDEDFIIKEIDARGHYITREIGDIYNIFYLS